MGTAACATAAGKLKNLTDDKTDIEFENGKLTISIDEKIQYIWKPRFGHKGN